MNRLFPLMVIMGIAVICLLPANAQLPVISEFLANTNDCSLIDEDGDHEDWIELANPHSSDLPIGGYFLSDDPLQLTRWQIPAGTMIPAEGYLVIYASGKNRTPTEGPLHTDFKLSASGESLILVAEDGETVIDSYTWTDMPGQSPGKSLGKMGDPVEDQFFLNPTPGAENAGPFFTPGRVLFDQDSQTFTGSILVTLSSEIEGMDIRYTTDRSEPTSASNLYQEGAPIVLSATAMLRARLVDPNDSQTLGDVSARHYIKLSTSTISASRQAGADTLPEFTSNLPIVIVENAGGSPANETVLSPTSITVFEPINGVASLADTPALSTRAGYRIRGQSSSNFPKKQYRVEFWNQEDKDKDVSVLGLPSESDWVLGAPYTDKALIRNSLIYDLGRTIGLFAPRTRHVEVFLNENGGALNYATDYRGVYLLTETNKLSRNRIDVEEAGLGDTEEPEISGGYLMKWEAGGAVSVPDRLPGWSSLELVDPDALAEATGAQKQWISDYVRELDDRIKSDLFKDPVEGYAPFLDVPSYANLFVINELSRDQDAYIRSGYFYKPRGGPITMGPLWDYNLIMGTGCFRQNCNAVPVGIDTGWQYKQNDERSESHWEVRLDDDPDFWQAFVDRWQELREDVLSDAGLHGRMDVHATPLAEAAIRNFAKWPNLGTANVGFPTPVTTTWEGQVDFMKTWSLERMAWIDSQMTAPPVISPASGVIAQGQEITLDGEQGTIYYTLDGSDPRLAQGVINPNALMYVPGLVDLVSRADTWSYLDDGSDQGASDIVVGNQNYGVENWKHPDFDDAAWASGPAPLGYSNNVTTEVDFGSTSDRHITTYFRKRFTVSGLSNFVLLEMEIQYDDGAIVYLNGKRIGSFNMPDDPVGFDDVASNVQGGINERTWFTMAVDLNDLLEGANVIALELHQISSGSNDLSFDFSLKGRLAAKVPITETTTITARVLEGEAWSGPQQELYVVGPAGGPTNLVISEIHYNPEEPSVDEMNASFMDKDEFEFIEFLNVGNESINLSGVKFTIGLNFEFPVDFELVPGARTLAVRNKMAILMRYPHLMDDDIAGVFQGEMGLGNDQDTLTLVSVSGSIIHQFTYLDSAPWPSSANGDGFSLTLIDPWGLPDHADPTNWRGSVGIHGTPNDTDATMFAGGDRLALLNYANGGALPQINFGEDGLVRFSIPLNLLADDLIRVMQVSDDLDEWIDADDFFVRESLVESGGFGTLTLRAVGAPAQSKRFIRYHFEPR